MAFFCLLRLTIREFVPPEVFVFFFSSYTTTSKQSDTNIQLQAHNSKFLALSNTLNFYTLTLFYSSYYLLLSILSSTLFYSLYYLPLSLLSSTLYSLPQNKHTQSQWVAAFLPPRLSHLLGLNLSHTQPLLLGLSPYTTILTMGTHTATSHQPHMRALKASTA